MLSVIMLSIIMLSVIMLSVIMLSVVMLSVRAPINHLSLINNFQQLLQFKNSMGPYQYLGSRQ